MLYKTGQKWYLVAWEPKEQTLNGSQRGVNLQTNTKMKENSQDAANCNKKYIEENNNMVMMGYRQLEIVNIFLKRS